MFDQYYFGDIFSDFQFGKYRGYPLFKVIVIDESYIYWCVNNIKDFKISYLAYIQIRDLFPNFIIPKSFAFHIIGYKEYTIRCELHEIDPFDNSHDCSNCGFNDCVAYCGDDSRNIGGDSDPRNDWGDRESPTYNRYHGSWAQDEMGFSDDDIDTIFDGDPSAYWNID